MGDMVKFIMEIANGKSPRIPSFNFVGAFLVVSRMVKPAPNVRPRPKLLLKPRRTGVAVAMGLLTPEILLAVFFSWSILAEMYGMIFFLVKEFVTL